MALSGFGIDFNHNIIYLFKEVPMFQFIKNFLSNRNKLPEIHHDLEKCKTGDLYITRAINIINQLKGNKLSEQKFTSCRNMNQLIREVLKEVYGEKANLVDVNFDLKQIVVIRPRGLNQDNPYKEDWLKFPISSPMLNQYQIAINELEKVRFN